MSEHILIGRAAESVTPVAGLSPLAGATVIVESLDPIVATVGGVNVTYPPFVRQFQLDGTGNFSGVIIVPDNPAQAARYRLHLPQVGAKPSTVDVLISQTSPTTLGELILLGSVALAPDAVAQLLATHAAIVGSVSGLGHVRNGAGGNVVINLDGTMTAPGGGDVTQAQLTAHTSITTAAHGGIVASGDTRLTNARPPTGSAGGVLSGNYPSPSFAADMATQVELDAALLLKENALGNPDVSGKVLSSTVGGVRSWIVMASGAAALTWVSLTPYLVNSGGTTWAAEGGSFAPIEYAIDGAFVRIRGAVARTLGSGSIIFTALPVGIRPAYRQFIATAAAAGFAELNILPAGDVQLWTGGTSALQLTYGWWL